MRIGNQELNDDEAAWCRTFAGEISNFATKKAISNLNKKLTQEEVQRLLQYLWGTPEVTEEAVPEVNEYEEKLQTEEDTSTKEEDE